MSNFVSLLQFLKISNFKFFAIYSFPWLSFLEEYFKFVNQNKLLNRSYFHFEK